MENELNKSPLVKQMVDKADVSGMIKSIEDGGTEEMTWDELPLEVRLKINQYYHKLAISHPNMNADRLMKACGKKFNLKFELV
jgi:hypothetical protein